MDPLARQHASELDQLRRGLADLAVDAHFDGDPTMDERYGPGGRRIWKTEAASRLAQLVEAMACDRPQLYGGHAAWSVAALRARNVPEGDVHNHFASIAAALDAELPSSVKERARRFTAAANDAMASSCAEEPGLLAERSRDATLARLYLLNLLQRDTEEATKLAMDALRGGMTLSSVYEQIVAPALAEVGRMWHMQEASIADEHFCTATTRTIIAQLRAATDAKPADGRRAICFAVGGDMHDLVIRMASDLLEIDGWKVEFLGADMPSSEIVMTIEAASADPASRVHLVVAGAGTNLSIRSMMELASALKASPECAGVSLLVGGRPFALDPGLAAAIGADASVRRLSEVVDAAARLVPVPRAPTHR